MSTPCPKRESVRIAPYTSMRVGGTVRFLFQPTSEEMLCDLLASLHRDHVKTLVIGNASNLLFPDEGFDGAVIRTDGIKQLSVQGNVITASCGVSLSSLASFAAQNGKGGLSFAYGIPGTVGGGVYMNAGAYGGQLSDRLQAIVCAQPDGSTLTLSGEQMHLSYRHSVLQERPLTLLHAMFSCPDAPTEDCKREMEQYIQARRAKQPLEYPSCGSVFKRPQGNFAGALIEQAGLKGLTVGGAQVSEKHAGFIINLGNATASDVKTLMRTVQETVFAQSGVRLEPEICIL